MKIEGNIFISDDGQRGCVYDCFTHTKAILAAVYDRLNPLPIDSHES